MTSRPPSHNNPFNDAAAIPDDNYEGILESALSVGNNASLTLSTDGVIITGQHCS